MTNEIQKLRNDLAAVDACISGIQILSRAVRVTQPELAPEAKSRLFNTSPRSPDLLSLCAPSQIFTRPISLLLGDPGQRPLHRAPSTAGACNAEANRRYLLVGRALDPSRADRLTGGLLRVGL
jgi:hypothetical protein